MATWHDFRKRRHRLSKNSTGEEGGDEDVLVLSLDEMGRHLVNSGWYRVRCLGAFDG